MSKMKSFQVIALTLSMLMIISMVKGRWLDLETYSTSMISVGLHNISNENPPNLRLEISNSSTLHAEQRCKSLYGFFPCADTMLESVFLMFMYMYFMILGDELMRTGSKVLFQWIGDRKFGESVFGMLKALPRIALFVAAGFLSSASDAKNQVAFAVSMYAGSTVITLTLVWGIRIILSRDNLKKRSSRESDHQQDSSSRQLRNGSSHESVHRQDSSKKCLSLQFLTDTGVNIDNETGDMAVTMLRSLIPFAIVGLLHFVNTPAMNLLALVVSVVSLLIYFIYQVKSPWIRYRSLAYLKQENLRTRFFYHFIRLADYEDLVDKEGNFGGNYFKRIFDEADTNKDKHITDKELEDLVQKMFMLENKDNISKDSAKAAILIHFDRNNDSEISWDEFKIGCTNWLKEAISSGSVFENYWNQAKAINKQRYFVEKMMLKILEQVLEKYELVKEDGEPDREKIEWLFSQLAKHGDDDSKKIHRHDFKKFIEIKALDFWIALNDKVLDELVKELYHDENQLVEVKELVDGFVKWIEKATDPKKAIEKFEEEKATNEQRSNLMIIEKIMSRILEQLLEKHGLVKEDGEPDREKIEGLLSQQHKDNNDKIHRDELKQFIKIFGIALDHDKVLNDLVKYFDHDENQLIEKKVFVDGFIKWIVKAIDPKNAIEKFEEFNWVEIDALLKREKPKATIVYAIFGIAITITITSPFIASVRQFSTAAHIPFLFTSFVMAPLAMKAKMVIVALFNAQHHVRKNASLTFSEIYDQLVMDNLIGFVSLLATVNIKGLSWTYSAEVLAIMIPCAIVGVFAIKRDTYPLWASISAILLYPVSVYIYYVLPNAS